MIRLAANEHIVHAWGERASGPGWSNQPTWVLVREAAGKLRIECVQPQDLPRGSLDLWEISALVHAQMSRLFVHVVPQGTKP